MTEPEKVKPSEALREHGDKIAAIIEAHKGKNPRVFGSVAEFSDTKESDLNLLIDPTEHLTLFDLCGMEAEIADLLQVRVDIRTPLSIRSRDRDDITKHSVPLDKMIAFVRDPSSFPLRTLLGDDDKLYWHIYKANDDYAEDHDTSKFIKALRVALGSLEDRVRAGDMSSFVAMTHGKEIP